MKKPGVDILLATYNGEDYVREQINSLREQTYTDWRLLVHDDGSTDDTMRIVREIASRDHRIKIIDDGETFGNAPDNFFHLLRHSEAPRVMFCDQDDIWFPEKIERMLKEGEMLVENVPGVVYSRANYWNPRRGILGQTWNRFPVGLPAFLGQKAAVQGSASMINSVMRETMLKYRGPVPMHDYLVGLIANSFGQAVYMEEILMNYRQHSRNVTGNNDEVYSGVAWLKRKMSNRPVMDAVTLETVKTFYRTFKDRIPLENKKIFLAFFKLESKTRPGRAIAVLRNGFARDGSVKKLVAKMLVSPYMSREDRKNHKGSK